jgi:O-antigen/teichoic acid export membrane protein
MSAADGSTGLGRRLVANTLHAASGRLAAVLVWLVLTPPILGALGIEGFAVWSLFFALTGYFAALDFGLVQGTLRHVAAARERGAHEEAGAFATLAVLGFVVLGLLWLAVTTLLHDPLLAWLRIPPAQSGAAGFAMVAGAGVFTLAGLANVAMALAQGYGRFDLANAVLLAVTAQQAVGIPMVLRFGWGLRGLVVNVGLGWALGLALGLVVLRRFVPQLRWCSPRASLARLRELVRFGGPMQVSSVLAALHAHLDKFLLARFVALAAVTPYELGSRVATAALTFPQLLLLAMMPAAAALHAGADALRLRELYDRGGRYVLTAAAVTAAALLGAADRLYLAWLGPGHGDAALVLRGLALAGALTLATGMASVTARGIGRTDLEAWSGAVVVAIHLALSLWLLPVLGLRGALVAFLVANAVGYTCFLWWVGGALGWRRAGLLLGPHAVPALALAAGAAAGWGCDRLLPRGAGRSAWGLLAVVAAAAALVALAVAVAARYFQWREARALLSGAQQPPAAAGEGSR